jgi:dGTPase
LFQRGQARLLTSLVRDLESWLEDPLDASRAPQRLLDLVQLATDGYRELARTAPELIIGPTGEPATSADDLARMGRGRGIIDYVASMTDDRALATAVTLGGHAGQLWAGGSGL